MHQIAFVTSNEKKLQSPARVLAQYGITVEHIDDTLPEIQDPAVTAVARFKAQEAWRRHKTPLFVQDSGLAMHAYKGFPGTNLKQVLEQLELVGILRMMRGVHDRSCTFEEAIVARISADESMGVFDRQVHGRLARSPMGPLEGKKSPIDALFIPDGWDITVSAMTEEQYAQYRQSTDIEDCYHRLAKYLQRR